MISAGVIAVDAVLGAVVGSYVTTAALRASDEDAPAGTRSLCDGCRRALAWPESLPIVSYVALRGSCRTCKARISVYHPVGELIGLLAGAGIASAASGYATALLGVLAALLLASSVFDARVRILPDMLTAAAAIIAGALALRQGGDTLVVGVVFAIFWLVILGVAAWDFRRRRGKTGLGWGDIKLCAALSLWLGAASPFMLLFAICIAALQQKIWPPEDRALVLGPMLAGSGFCIGLLLEAGLWPRL